MPFAVRAMKVKKQPGFVLSLALALAWCALAQCAERDYYTAGVVEFRPVVGGMTSAAMLEEHLNAYLDIIASTEAQPTDILVFPEATLNSVLQATFVPSPAEWPPVAPCDGDATARYAAFLVRLSCAAREAGKYVVINLTEQEACPASDGDTRPCAANGLNVYNTNVVFDRQGRVVSRYRKVHSYQEAKNTTLLPEYAMFETDFGVRFGHFICFDINFYTPAEELVRRFGVRDFIFTSWFYSELPFLTAVQLQQAWALGNDVNLLAAGASHPAVGTTGSGIYAAAAGQLSTLMVGGAAAGGQRRLLVARVPMNGGTAQPQAPATVGSVDLPLMRDPQIENFTSLLLDGDATVDETLCHGDQCCRFEVRTLQTAVTAAPLRYRVGVFNGVRTYEEAEFSNLKICALYACLNESVSSCALLPPPPSSSSSSSTSSVHAIAFQGLRISGAFPNAERVLLMPNSLTSQLQPLPATAFEWHADDYSGDNSNNNNNNIINVQLALSSDANAVDLLTFAIYGNYYDKSIAMPTPSPPINDDDDDDDDDGSRGVSMRMADVKLIIAFCLCLLFVNRITSALHLYAHPGLLKLNV